MSVRAASTALRERMDGAGVTERAMRARPGVRWVLLAGGLLFAVALPWLMYPPIAFDIACFALLAIAVDLLLGYTGLLSFGHAAFWGTAAYTATVMGERFGAPLPLAVLAAVLAAALLAVPVGYLAVKCTGIYFAMVTLAFAQMIFFVANQWRTVTGGENGLVGPPPELFGIDLSDPFLFYYAGLPFILAGIALAWRVVHSPFGRVMVAIRDNPSRVQALGYPVHRYKLGVFVISATLAGLAGGLFAISHGFASLQEVYWTTSGKAVMIVVLGGMGTLWGSVVGSYLVVQLEYFLSGAGFGEIGLVTGSIFVVVVLLFRRGIWGSAQHLLRERVQRSRVPAERRSRPGRDDAEQEGSAP
ncbi:branched-chain amino acid ABC transporter permease [Haloechinothrix sp. YIM 98757]|uniref:Branched-chain amino acid ABC transporter permease n=1 Tax=Haloechinothrix aidingensis TaxID=2752311 RepID=A0A838AB30_9PSEU|nr:branched-chain amino acid ABC transporter permease [Haloechinothrix aidingensis]MBA0126449.1 branched-chain amino acid ABC transporter permease [Haloechinothrix aidingensis]